MSVKLKINDSLNPSIDNVGVGMWVTQRQDRIKCYHQELAKHSIGEDFELDLLFDAHFHDFFTVLLGFEWVRKFNRVKQLDEDIAEEKKNARSANGEFEMAIMRHEMKVQVLKDDTQRIAAEGLN